MKEKKHNKNQGAEMFRGFSDLAGTERISERRLSRFAPRQRGSKRPEEDGLLRHRRGGGRPPEEPDEQLPPLHRQSAGNRHARQQGETGRHHRAPTLD